jgi:hypothetical protein
MIGHYLPNNNENATVPILPKNLELNWAIVSSVVCKTKEELMNRVCFTKRT